MQDFGEKCPRHFPGKISRNFRNFRNFPKFPRNFPGIFPDFPRFFNDKKIDFRSVTLRFPSKNPSIFREFSGNFRGKFSRIFGISGIFRKFLPEFSPIFLLFYKHKKIDLRSVSLRFTEKKPEISGKFSGEISSVNFSEFRKFPRKFPRNFPRYAILLQK